MVKNLRCHVAPLGRPILGRAMWLHCFCVRGMRWLQALIRLCSVASSFSKKKQVLILHMGATKLVGSNFNFCNKTKNPTLKLSVQMIDIVQIQ